jgi:hypothetical protein
MKRTKLIIGMAALWVLALGAPSVQAQSIVPTKLTFKLAVQAQDMYEQQVGTSPNFKSTIFKAKVTNKEILQLLELACDRSFTGDTIAMDDVEGDFVVLDSSGNVVTNVTAGGILSNFFDSEDKDYLEKGTHNDATGSENYTWTYFNALQFADSANGNSFRVSGIEEWKYVYNGNNGKYTDSFKFTASGAGALGTPLDGGDTVDFFLLSGTITGKASGID